MTDLSRVLRWVPEVPRAERPSVAGPEPTGVPALKCAWGMERSIYQRAWEFETLLELYRKAAPARVLEVGAYTGGTLWWWLQEAAVGATVVSVDTYDGANFAQQVDNRALYPLWTPEDVELVVIEGDSRRPRTRNQILEHGPYDWIFLDGDHLYRSARSDWESYGKSAREGSVVVFHDILEFKRHPEIEVHQLWREIRAQGYLTQELVAKGSAWGGLGLVYL